MHQSRELGFLLIDQTTYLYNPLSLSYDATSQDWSAPNVTYQFSDGNGKNVTVKHTSFPSFYHVLTLFGVPLWGKGIFVRAISLSFLNHYLRNNVVIISSTIPQVVRCAVYESSFFWTKASCNRALGRTYAAPLWFKFACPPLVPPPLIRSNPAHCFFPPPELFLWRCFKLAGQRMLGIQSQTVLSSFKFQYLDNFYSTVCGPLRLYCGDAGLRVRRARSLMYEGYDTSGLEFKLLASSFKAWGITRSNPKGEEHLISTILVPTIWTADEALHLGQGYQVLSICPPWLSPAIFQQPGTSWLTLITWVFPLPRVNELLYLTYNCNVNRDQRPLISPISEFVAFKFSPSVDVDDGASEWRAILWTGIFICES